MIVRYVAEIFSEPCLRAVMSAALNVAPDDVDPHELRRGVAAIRAALPFLTVELTR